jgi:hypothetical protein
MMQLTTVLQEELDIIATLITTNIKTDLMTFVVWRFLFASFNF